MVFFLCLEEVHQVVNDLQLREIHWNEYISIDKIGIEKGKQIHLKVYP